MDLLATSCSGIWLGKLVRDIQKTFVLAGKKVFHFWFVRGFLFCFVGFFY